MERPEHRRQMWEIVGCDMMGIESDLSIVTGTTCLTQFVNSIM